VNFEIEDAITALMDAVDKLLAQTDAAAENVDGQRSYFSAGLDADLEQGGFFDAAGVEDFGPVAAAMVVQRVSATTHIVEAANSALVRPFIGGEWPRPLAILSGDASRPARFLAQARTVIILGADRASIVSLDKGDAVAVSSLFAYPMGQLADPAACLARAEPIEDHALVRRMTLLATACELAGVLQGGLTSVNDYVKTRQQFGRPIGSFQGVQHRLALAASNIAAGTWLGRKAAGDGTMQSALLAVGYLQDCAPRIVYDLHQFMGAMGLTLEHPLYRWSYRARLLLSDLGGASTNLRDAADQAWA
jgi:hypothetical protein